MIVTATADSGFGDDQAWPPGFRFHPTDEELVLYYLKRKICKKRLKLDIIRETDVYKWDPEELPGQSILKSGDRQWFFFTPRDRRYPNGSRSNRGTGRGYWKATGKDRLITCNSRTVGVKKTLVFYRGRAPSGERTDWVMHEYTLDEEELSRCQNVQDYFALYKLYKKSGPGPKNGEQYGAPFKEEEWADEEIASNPVNTVSALKPHNEAILDDNIKANGQVQSQLNDVEEFMRQLADQPAIPQPQAHFGYVLPQVSVEEETQSTLLNPSPRDGLFPEPAIPLRVLHDQTSLDFSLSPTSQLQLHEVPEVTSVADQFEQVPQKCDEDFLEIDDLINPVPLTSNFEKPGENGQFSELDGLSEFDLFHDAAMFLQDLGPIDQGTLPFSYGNMMNQASYQLESQSNMGLMDQQLQPQSNVNLMDQQSQQQSNINLMDQQLQPQLNFLGDNQQWHSQLNAFGDNMLNQVGFQSQSRSYSYMMDQQFIPHSTVDQVDYQLQFQSVGNKQDQQLQMDDVNGLLWTDDQNGDILIPSGSDFGNASPASGLVCNGINENQGDKNGGDGGGSLFSAALWSLVESIPTTPASASERALERISSFSKLKLINARKNEAFAANVSATGRRRKGANMVMGGLLFLIFILGALCAILWLSIGNVRVLALGLGRSISD